MHVTKENVATIIMIAEYIKNSCIMYAIRISATFFVSTDFIDGDWLSDSCDF